MQQTDNPHKGRVIQIHGHRGARGIMPENTLEGFSYALSIGVKILELDVMVTRDDVVVATHNLHLEPETTRTPDGDWLSEQGPGVRSLSLDEIQSFDVGGIREGTSYGDRFSDQAFMTAVRIPTLEEVFQLMSGPLAQDACLNIEVKSDPTQPHLCADVDHVVDMVLSAVRTYGFEERVIIQSFDWRIMQLVQKKAPTIVTSYLTKAPDGSGVKGNISSGSLWTAGHDIADYDGSITKLIKAAGGCVWAPYFQDLTKEDLREAQASGLTVNVWTVNELADIDAMITLGVDGIISDYPARVQRQLKKHGLLWGGAGEGVRLTAAS